MSNSKSAKSSAENDVMKPFNELMDEVIERVEMDDPRLKASVDKWVDAMREKYVTETGLYDSVHRFSSESRKKSVELLKTYLERSFIFSARNWLCTKSIESTMIFRRPLN